MSLSTPRTALLSPSRSWPSSPSSPSSPPPSHQRPPSQPCSASCSDMWGCSGSGDTATESQRRASLLRAELASLPSLPSSPQWLSSVAAELRLELARVNDQLAALTAHQLNIGELALRPRRIVTDDEEPALFGQLLCAGLDPTDPEPQIDDPGSWRGAPTHRRAYQSWHAREQRRKKRPAPAAVFAPAPTAPRRQSGATASSSTASAADAVVPGAVGSGAIAATRPVVATCGLVGPLPHAGLVAAAVAVAVAGAVASSAVADRSSAAAAAVVAAADAGCSLHHP